ncbi:MAG: glycosyl hydrolase family 18 protein, partial [Bacteroidales bacterium]|nr:glycosyl hydrolase family 18 protein [Bacteroidales bacterium]
MHSLFITSVLSALFLFAGCGPERSFSVPAPHRVVTGAIEDPFNPGDEPAGPDDPEPPVPSEDSARLARIGQFPVVEVYYTEYTDKALFPSEEEIRNFTIVNVGHGRFVNKKTGDGGITIADEDLLRRMVAFKQTYPALKVKLMIGGWGKNADGFSMMARDAGKRKLFVDECVRICDEFGLDGVDIDWEYPTYAAKDGSYINGACADDYQNFVTVVKDLRPAMLDEILSYSGSECGQYSDNLWALEYVDYINVMTYSMGNPPYHNSPLYSSPIAKSRSCAEVIDVIFHGNQNIPYNRMNFGVAFYGHGDGYSGSDKAVYPSTVNYSMLEDIFFRNTCKGNNVKGKNYRYWDDVAKVPFLGDALGTMYASYEDIESLNCKVEYILSREMLGAMAWEYREDDAKGTLRHALRHAMSGNPDSLTDVERPEEHKPSENLPVMGSYTKYKLDNVTELSGLCLSADASFLWGVGDQGNIYKISFSGVATPHWYHDADMEGVTMNPDTKDLYISIEGSQKLYLVSAPDYNTYKTL